MVRWTAIGMVFWCWCGECRILLMHLAVIIEILTQLWVSIACMLYIILTDGCVQSADRSHP